MEPFILDFELNGNWKHRHFAEQIGFRGIEAHIEEGMTWQCGTGKAGHSPNLMVGTAGIGYFYLRLHDPLTTPSILALSVDI